MKIEYIDVKKITPYAQNAKTHPDKQVEHIANSIEQFGFKQPLVIDKDNILVIGHGRLLAAKRLHIDSVPCVRADDLTDEQIKALRLADNKTNESEWDYGFLGSELEDILNIDMTDFGFNLEGFGDEDDPAANEIEEDDAPEDVPTRVTLGDVWQLGRHRLICGDSTDVDVIGRLTGDISIDLVFTDPPYGINAVNEDGNLMSESVYHEAKRGVYKPIIADDTTETAQAAYNVLSQICKRLIFWGGNYFTDFLPFSDGWLVWDKRGESGIRNNFADGEMAWCSFHTPVRIYHQLWNGMIREGEHEKRVHPTQKPIRMLSEIINDYSKEGDTILDAFGGSGSTLIACEQMKRTCYMCELDPHYCDVIIARWEKLTGQVAEIVKED